MNLHEAIVDAVQRDWEVTFQPGERATMTIDGVKRVKGQKWCSRRVIRLPDLRDETSPDLWLALEIEKATDDRQLPQPPKPEGWAWPLNMPKAHYIVNGISLCRKCGYLGSQIEPGNDDSPDNCKECQKRLAKRKL